MNKLNKILLQTVFALLLMVVPVSAQFLYGDGGSGGGGAPSGPAGGVLGGTYPNPSFASTTGTGATVLQNTPTLITPVLGVANGTSLAIGGATIGSNALAVTGTANISGKTTALNVRVTSSDTPTVVDIGTSDTQGLIWNGGNDATFINLGTPIISFGNSVARGVRVPSNSFYGFTSVTTDSYSSADTTLSRNAAGIVQFGTTSANAAGSWLATNGTLSGRLTMSVAAPISIASGSNQRAGNATLVGGTVTVSNTTVTANTVVLLTRKTSGGTIGTAITYTLSAGASFTIASDNILDTSVFSYTLIEVP